MAGPDTDLIHATRQVIAVLDSLQIPYCVGGSLASSIHGIPRATIDGDIVAAMALRHCRPLSDGLAAEFVVAHTAIVQAVHNESSFNAIHRDSIAKVDVFVAKSDHWYENQMRRRQLIPFGSEMAAPAFVSSPEDTILAKLDWYRLGGGTSDRQWGDVLGVIKVQAESLDVGYLRQWAEHLRLSELLARALDEGGLN
jgi:hypothetical protein